MENLIIINSCMREDSRTKIILDSATTALAERYEIEAINVNSLALPPLSPEVLAERSAGRVAKATIDIAKKIAAAERIVIAAPFWDMSFPAILKAFFENMSLYNITFTDNGATCTGLCKCKRVLYITTRGMDIPTGDFRDQGTSYLKALSSLWGLGDIITVAAWNLDYLPASKVDERVSSASELAKEIAKTF